MPSRSTATKRPSVSGSSSPGLATTMSCHNQVPGRRREAVRSVLILRPHIRNISRALFVSDRLHDLPHLHGISGWNLLKRKSQLIPCDPSETLKHRPELLQHIRFFFGGVAAPQNAIERGRRSLRPTGKARSLRIRKEDDTNEALRYFHHSGVDSCDLFCHLRLGLARDGTILGNRGVERHSSSLRCGWPRT